MDGKAPAKPREQKVRREVLPRAWGLVSECGRWVANCSSSCPALTCPSQSSWAPSQEVLEVRAQHLPSPSLLFCSLPLSLPPESMIPERPLRNLETTSAGQCRKRGDHTIKALPLLWRGKTHCSRSFCQPERQGRTSFILAPFASTHTTLAPSFLVCCPRGRRIGDEWPSGGRLGFGGPYTSLC